METDAAWMLTASEDPAAHWIELAIERKKPWEGGRKGAAPRKYTKQDRQAKLKRIAKRRARKGYA